MSKDSGEPTVHTLVLTTHGLRIEVPYQASTPAGQAIAPVSRRRLPFRRVKPTTPPSPNPAPVTEPDLDFPPPKIGGPGSMIIRPIKYQLGGGFEPTITQLAADFAQVRSHSARELATMLRRDLGLADPGAFLLLDVIVPSEEVAKGVDPGDFAALLDPDQGGMHAVRLLWDPDLSNK